MEETKFKNTCKHIPIIIVLAVLLAGAIGFGIFEIINVSGKDKKISDLESEIAAAQSSGSNIEYKQYGSTETETETEATEETKPEEKTETKTETTPAPTVTSASGYIYIGGWTIKLNVPEGFNVTGYLFNGDALYVTGTSALGGQYIPSFASIEQNTSGLGSLTRISLDEYNAIQGAKGEIVKKDGDNVFVYTHPQSVHSNEQSEMEWEQKSTDLVKLMLTKSLSKF